jgi:hypothetical protein
VDVAALKVALGRRRPDAARWKITEVHPNMVLTGLITTM